MHDLPELILYTRVYKGLILVTRRFSLWNYEQDLYVELENFPVNLACAEISQRLILKQCGHSFYSSA